VNIPLFPIAPWPTKGVTRPYYPILLASVTIFGIPGGRISRFLNGTLDRVGHHSIHFATWLNAECASLVDKAEQRMTQRNLRFIF
jgi:hypothetical protein